MPIYEYACDKCEHVFEEWQKDFDEHNLPCPKCGGSSHKIISHSAFVLKGSGWYVTDYCGKKSDGCEKTSAASKSANPETPSSSCSSSCPAAAEGNCPAKSQENKESSASSSSPSGNSKQTTQPA